MFVSTDEMCQGCVWGYQKIKGEKTSQQRGRRYSLKQKGTKCSSHDNRPHSCSARLKTNSLKLLPIIERLHGDQENHYSKGLNQFFAGEMEIET